MSVTDYTIFPAKRKYNTCWYCGQRLGKGHKFESAMPISASVDGHGIKEWYRSEPVRPENFESDVFVPAVQSLINGIVSTPPILVWAMYYDLPWYVGPLAASVVVTVSWIAKMRGREDLVNIVENVTFFEGRSKDVPISQSSKGQSISLDITDKQAKSGLNIKFFDLPPTITEQKFLDFVKGVKSGKSLARKVWIGSGKLFTRDQYDALMVALEAGGVVGRNENNARVLTNGGKRAIARMVDSV